jgi:hypothetical protein
MRLIFYKKKAQDGSDSTMYVNLDSVDSINMHPKDNVTEMYFITGNDVHLVYDKEKIISPDVVISKLLSISDRSFVEIDKFIKDCNAISKTRR